MFFFFLKESFKELISTEVAVEKLGPTHRVILQLLVVHVNDVGTDAIQKVLGMGDEDQDALKTVKPEKTSQGGAQNCAGSQQWSRKTQKPFIFCHPYSGTPFRFYSPFPAPSNQPGHQRTSHCHDTLMPFSVSFINLLIFSRMEQRWSFNMVVK